MAFDEVGNDAEFSSEVESSARSLSHPVPLDGVSPFVRASRLRAVADAPLSQKQPLRDEVAPLDEQEWAYLRAELETAREKYRLALSQYKELTVYCDAFLKDAEERKEKAEERIQSLDSDLSKLRSEYARSLSEVDSLEGALARVESERADLRGLLREREWELGQLRSRFEEEREKGRKVDQELDSSRRKELEASLRLEALSSRLKEREKALNHFCRSLDSAIASVSEMGQMVETYVERILKNGVNALTEQTGKVLCEQVRGELRNLSALQALVRGVSERPGSEKSE